MQVKRIIQIFILGFTLAVTHSFARPRPQESYIETEHASLTIRHEEIGLVHPWGLAILPDSEGILVTERVGNLRLMDGSTFGEPITGLPDIFVSGQGGLLDVAIDPKFTDNRLIYFSYSKLDNGKSGTSVARAKLMRNGHYYKLTNLETIFDQPIKTGATRHYGSRLIFDREGQLFVTLGDRGDSDRAQKIDDEAGMIIRIDVDASPISIQNWSIGHRNPQGAAFNSDTGELWITEHGAKGGDELNRALAGRNYGWPIISYGRHYWGGKIGVGTAADGFEQPVHYWDPSIAPSGLSFYVSELVSQWRGNLFAGALKFKLISRLVLEKSDGQYTVSHEEQWDLSKFGRIRDLEVDDKGHIWFITDEAEGGLYWIIPTPK